MEKKTTELKKLKLSKSTIVALDKKQTRQIVGGDTSFFLPTQCQSCTCDPSQVITGCATC